MSNEQEKKYGQFYDALTSEMTTRELTAEEIAALPEPAPILESEK